MTARAISGTRRAFKELVDGTLRVQIDVDPEHRKDFLRLFSEIDMRVAIAPLKADAKPAHDGPKGGELARLAGIFCSDNDFRLWLSVQAGKESLALANGIEDPAERAAVVLRDICCVRSRAELDHNALAAELFHERIRKPWAQYKGVS